MEGAKIVSIIFYLISLLIGIFSLAAGGVQSCPDNLWTDFPSLHESSRKQYYALAVHTIVSSCVVIVASIICLVVSCDLLAKKLGQQVGLIFTIASILFYMGIGVSSAVSYHSYVKNSSVAVADLKDTLKPLYNLLNATLADAILIFVLALPLMIAAAFIRNKNLEELRGGGVDEKSRQQL